MPVTPAGAPKKAVEAPAAAASAKKQANGLNVATPSHTSGPPAMIMREVYEYSRDGRRDPFISLLLTNELRPTMSDLKLTSLIYDANGVTLWPSCATSAPTPSIACKGRFVLGRMHVAAIREHWIVFTIDEFGTNRQDSLVLGDTSKARLK